MGNDRGGRRNYCPLIFLPLRNQNTNFISLSSSKNYTFFAPKKRLPLSVNAFRFNQQALINYNIHYSLLRNILCLNLQFPQFKQLEKVN